MPSKLVKGIRARHIQPLPELNEPGSATAAASGPPPVAAEVVEEDGDKGQWLRVAPSPGNFIVNLGDMLERWTNDFYQSTIHRVINFEGKERFSIPFFFEPNFTTVVECLPAFVTEENPAKYPPTTSGLHLLSKYAQTHANFQAEDSEGKKD